jgi:hypothetical protein
MTGGIINNEKKRKKLISFIKTDHKLKDRMIYVQTTSFNYLTHTCIAIEETQNRCKILFFSLRSMCIDWNQNDFFPLCLKGDDRIYTGICRYSLIREEKRRMKKRPCIHTHNSSHVSLVWTHTICLNRVLRQSARIKLCNIK